MGTRFEIHVYGKFNNDSYYSYQMYWGGQSLVKALFMLIKAKRAGYGCVKLEWR